METVLIFRIGSLGDTVVALPCFHRIAGSFPKARRLLVTDSPVSRKVAPVESVLRGSTLIDDVIYFPPPPRALDDLLTFRRRLKDTGASTLIYVADRTLASTLRDVCFFRLSGMRHIVGAPFASGLRRLRVDAQTGETEYEAERLARCLAPLGAIDLNDPAMWDLRLQPDEIRRADAALGALAGAPFIALGLGGKVPMKDWGDPNWSELLRSMATRYADIGLVFVGSTDEFARLEGLAAQWPGQTLNLCGRLSARESAAAMRPALFFLGHDTGPMHLAAAVGVPCIALFGPYNRPRWWHPFGPQHRVIHDMRGIRLIAPAQVMAQIEAALPERRPDESVA